MSNDVTPWFDGIIKPYHQGVYQRDNGCDLLTYSYWNGIFWGYFCSKPEEAYDSREHKSSLQKVPWRGLCKQP